MCETFTAQQAGEMSSLHIELNPDHGGVILAYVTFPDGNPNGHLDWMSMCKQCGWHACIIEPPD